MMEKRIDIELSPGTKGTRVFIDGKELNGVKDVWVRHKLNDVPHVELLLIAETVTVKGLAEDIKIVPE